MKHNVQYEGLVETEWTLRQAVAHVDTIAEQYGIANFTLLPYVTASDGRYVQGYVVRFTGLLDQSRVVAFYDAVAVAVGQTRVMLTVSSVNVRCTCE
jgi:hypothetical protein